MSNSKPCIFLFFLLQISLVYSQSQNLYISGEGSDNIGNGDINSPYKSLERALEDISSPGQITYNLILKPSSSGYVSHTKSNTGQLIWIKSGSQEHPINVYSEGGTATINHVQSNAALIKLQDVSYVNFHNIKFQNSSLAIIMDNADYCRIQFCEFVGSPINGSGGSGCIWIGKLGFNPTNYTNTPTPSNERSDFNIIRNNHFSNIEILEYEKQHLYHAIYLSNGSYGNDIYFNTLEMGLNIGSGIQINHGYMNENNVSQNFIKKSFSSSNDSFMNSRHGINFQYENNSEISQTNNNDVVGNFLYANSYRQYVFPTNCDPNNSSNNNYKGPQLLRIRAQLCSNNNISSNTLTYDNDESYEDPLWSNHHANKMTDRMVSGDFDGDSIDDIATLYDNTGNNTILKIWLSSTNSFILSKGNDGWWKTGGYNANKTTGRMVSGDFDGNGFDDIAAFYDNGNSSTSLHMWLSSGTHITYQNSSGWWSTSGYDPNKITGRVVSGDFDGNGFDDIAAFYDNGNSSTSLHMWLSSGTHITYQNSSGWWSTSGYDPNKITGRVVSGDFDGNGFDDIAAFYDNGNSSTSLHMWLSSGTHITYQNSSGWWSTSGYDPNKITGRVVSGDFDDNGFDDIAAFYDNGNSSTSLHTWLSSGTHITYQNSNGWWNTSGYDVNKVKGRVVSGDYNNDGKTDISAFYDYSQTNGDVRSNIWHSTGNSFTYYNNSLGYPWKNLNDNIIASKALLIEEREVNENDPSKNEFIIEAFPNPVSNYSYLSLQFELDENAIVEIELYDMHGRKIKDIYSEQRLRGSQLIDDISLESVPKGLYFLRFKTQNVEKIFKILKN
ncbi:MAG: T9SS type A sorting domain-containing protein [Flavobacteriaceae bacterium]